MKTQNNSHLSLKYSKVDLVTNPIGAVNLQTQAKSKPYFPQNADTAPFEESKDEDKNATNHADTLSKSAHGKISSLEEDYIDGKLKDISKTLGRFSSNLNSEGLFQFERLNNSNDRAPRTIIKEISNFPVNILKVKNVKAPSDPTSSVSKEVHKVESQTSSVRVIVTKASRTKSTESPDTADNLEKSSKPEAFTQGNKKLSSKFRTFDAENKASLIQEINNIKEEGETGLKNETIPESFPELSSSLSLPLVIPKQQEKTGQKVMSFQEKVKQIREILANMDKKDVVNEPNKDSDYDYYDNEELPAQLKYLSLFDQKYETNPAGGETSIKISPMKNPSSFSVESKDKATASADTGSVDVSSEAENTKKNTDGDTKSKFNSTDDEDLRKFILGMEARYFPQDATSWPQSNVKEARLVPVPFSKQYNWDEGSHDINLEDLVKSITPSVQPLSLNNANHNLLRAAQSLFDKNLRDYENRYPDYPVEDSTSVEAITIQNVNSVFPICTTNSSSTPFEATEEHTLSTELEAPPLEVLPPVEFTPDVELAPAVEVLPEQAISQPLQTLNDNEAPDNLLEQSNGIVNTFLYNYEESNSIADDIQIKLEPLEPPLFLDSVVQDIPRGGGFQHFSVNDLDSEKFTSSFSNAQIRMYELYRDPSALTGSSNSPGKQQDSY